MFGTLFVLSITPHDPQASRGTQLMYPVRERQWEKDLLRIQYRINTPPKTNMDIQNDGLEKVDGPLKSGKVAIFGIYVMVWIGLLALMALAMLAGCLMHFLARCAFWRISRCAARLSTRRRTPNAPSTRTGHSTSLAASLDARCKLGIWTEHLCPSKTDHSNLWLPGIFFHDKL